MSTGATAFGCAEVRRKNHEDKLRQLAALMKEERELKLSFESRMAEMKEDIEQVEWEVKKAEFLSYHPHISALEIYLPISEIIMICLEYANDNLCIECRNIFVGEECFHKLHTHGRVEYIIKTCFVPHCLLEIDDFICYKVRDEEDQELLAYWFTCLESSSSEISKSVKGSGLDVYKCKNHPFPLFFVLGCHSRPFTNRRLSMCKSDDNKIIILFG